MHNKGELEDIFEKVNDILLNPEYSDYEKYLKIRKIKNLKNKYYTKEKTLKIMNQWYLDNIEYNIEMDQFNGHNWKNHYMKRYEKLVAKVQQEDNNSKKVNPKKTSPSKISPSKTSPKKNSPSKTSPKKNSPSKTSPSKTSPKKISPSKNITTRVVI